MSYSPIPIRPASKPSNPDIILPLHTRVETSPASEVSDADAILGTLRGAISAGASGLGPILNTVAEAAQTLTGATGSALALRRDGVVVCCARSGETAPEIGARVSEDSGITGECLRTGKMLRCDDTQKDYRVNPEVCRRLGLRSIAAVPLCSPEQVTGLLEVFSTRAYAFGEEQMNLLGRLADLAQAAQRRELVAEAKPTAMPAPEAAQAAIRKTQGSADLLRRLRVGLLGQRGRSVLVASASLVLLLVLVWGWRSQTKPEKVMTAAPVVPSQAGSEEELAIVAPTEVVVKPSPQTPVEADEESPARPAKVKAAKRSRANSSDSDREAPDTVIRTKIQRSSLPREAPLTQAHSAAPADEPIQQPELPVLAADTSDLGSVVAAPVSTPALALPVSEGVVPGKLLRQVEPLYPRQAQTMRLAGAVVLEATIGVDGAVKQVKVVSGNAVLAQAAIDAVRRWRYSPYRLNGQAVAAEAQITVNFKGPNN